MIGLDSIPSLLVDIEQHHSPDHFDFLVVNGDWYGTFINGNVTVHDCPSGDYTSLGDWKVLSTDSNRLCGNYQSVFDNWHNPNYVAPTQLEQYPPSWDDDIPF